MTMATFTPAALVLAQSVPQALQVGAVVIGALLGAIVIYWVLAAVFKGVGWAFKAVGRLFAHVFASVGGTITETLRAVHALFTAIMIVPMVVASAASGRASAAAHYQRALRTEIAAFLLSLYRAVLVWPLRLVGLGYSLESFESRMVDVVTRAPRGDGRGHDFEGYTIESSLPQGGSGAQLFLARPSAEHVKKLEAQGVKLPERVVIKSFGLSFGSSLPQMMRENRALEAARRMGLVFEHLAEGDRFYYVMPYVPGDDLGIVTRRLHEASGTAGLSDAALRSVIGYSNRLVGILGRFHDAGVWHKDIKPSNIVVNGSAVELIDLGLVTPLASAMTLTTHGTEYYRDPELVRQAMRGVKVHEVDGVKFDLYSTGAVLFSMIEDSFPAHGNLSRITKRCPEALGWIVRRAMAEPRQRYASAADMHADLAKLASVDDPFTLRPADLPSMGGVGVTVQPLPDRPSGLPRRSGPPPLPRDRRLAAREANRRRHIEEREAKRHVAHEQRLQRSGGGFRAFVGVAVLFVGILFLASIALLRARDVSYSPAPSPVAIVSPRFFSSAPSGGAEADPRQASYVVAKDADESTRPIVLILSESPRELLRAEERVRLAGLNLLLSENLGWRVVSETSTDDLPDVDEESVIADVRGAALMNQVGDDVGTERIQAYLDSSDAIDGVLWIGFDSDRIARHELLLDSDSKRFPRRSSERRSLVRSLGNLLD